ncbi:glutamine amidotransferase-related protein [Bradyrhizobium sp. DASA03007]|uniref:glutamine amidotransferase-related protein n=1 Tax=unclassified Bradyrhizobium TaxID=2631580 RepID=UPI003F6EE926
MTARSDESEIMALAHRSHPPYDVQFHPEFGTYRGRAGAAMNFLRLAKISGA